MPEDDKHEVKNRYYRIIKKRYGDFMSNQRLLSRIVDLQSSPKHERVEVLSRYGVIEDLRDFLNHTNKE